MYRQIKLQILWIETYIRRVLRRNYPLRFLRSVWLGVNTPAMVIVRHSQQINCLHIFLTELLPREYNATKSDADKHCLRRARTCYAPANNDAEATPYVMTFQDALKLHRFATLERLNSSADADSLH